VDALARTDGHRAARRLVRAVALLDQDLREHAVLERHDTVIAREAGGELGDTRHAVAVMVAAGKDARSAGRAQRGRVHVVETESVVGESVEIGGRDRTAEAAHVPVARIVHDHEEDVRRPRPRSFDGRPRWARLVRRPADHSGEGCAFWVFNDGHQVLHSGGRQGFLCGHRTDSVGRVITPRGRCRLAATPGTEAAEGRSARELAQGGPEWRSFEYTDDSRLPERSRPRAVLAG
jgi:hypothetical protein